jgi:cellulose synthase/poly-beta-1,6-N-acetylglucosamine synthase-like glycosyltransferase
MTTLALTEWTLNAASLVLLVLTLPGTVELALLALGAFLPDRATARSQTSASDGKRVRLAIIVPVYNEELGLRRTLRSVMACDDAPDSRDIIVMACNTTDRSVSIARALGCTTLERKDPARRGKGYGLDFAFRQLAHAGFDAYLVLDADTTVERNFVREFRRLFERGAAAGQCILRVANPGANTRTRLMNIAFLAFTFLRPLARQRLGLSVGIFGNGFGVRAHVIRKVPYNCYCIAEDLEYHTRLVRAGYRVEFLSTTSVSTEMCTTGAQATPQRQRWEGGRLRVLIEEAPALIRESTVGGRLDLLEPLLDLLLLPLAYHLLCLLALLLIASGAALIYAVFATMLLGTHVLQAMVAGGAGAAEWKALLMVPVYIGWKLLSLGGVIKSAAKFTPWRRTPRRSV